MLGIQVVGIIFGLFMLYLTFLHLKRKEFTIVEAVGWFVLWISIAFMTLFPNSLDFLVKGVLNLQRPLDFFIICGFLFLIFATFFNYSQNRKNDKKIEKIVSRIAIHNNANNKNSTNHHSNSSSNNHNHTHIQKPVEKYQEQ